jgi:thiol-disulfide isomerase/thioredoxin
MLVGVRGLGLSVLGVLGVLGALGACARALDAPRALSIPAPRAGADRLGEAVEATAIERWIGDPLSFAGPSAGRATLIRFWTDSCPYCEASLPALERLRTTYASSGLATLAVYHPKPPRDVDDDEVVRAAAGRGYHGRLAVDRDWRFLERVWLKGTSARAATSASLLLDARGTIRFVHPGPVFFPAGETHGSGPEWDAAASDFADLETAICALLGEPTPPAR